MSQPFDTLESYRKFVEGGMSAEEAVVHVAVITAAITEATAGKADEVRTDAKLADLRGELRREISEAKVDILKWVIGLLLAQTGIIAALVKLL